jgi:hypothetical protein
VNVNAIENSLIRDPVCFQEEVCARNWYAVQLFDFQVCLSLDNMRKRFVDGRDDLFTLVFAIFL